MAEVLAGAPDEVVTNAIVRMISLSPFGHTGELALITLDNGADHIAQIHLARHPLMHFHLQ